MVVHAFYNNGTDLRLTEANAALQIKPSLVIFITQHLEGKLFITQALIGDINPGSA